MTDTKCASRFGNHRTRSRLVRCTLDIGHDGDHRNGPVTWRQLRRHREWWNRATT